MMLPASNTQKSAWRPPTTMMSFLLNPKRIRDQVSAIGLSAQPRGPHDVIPQ